MTDWSLPVLLAGLHRKIEQSLAEARQSLAHPTTKGDASQGVWLQLLNEYLPRRYEATSAHVVDSKGTFSHQIDVLIYDRQYSPLIFELQGQKIVPAEAVYAAFEAKQSIDAAQVRYAQEKVESVRKLYRTSLPIPAVDGVLPAKAPGPILGGIVAFESNWSPALGEALKDALDAGQAERRLNLGCIAAHGIFMCDTSGCYTMVPEGKPATAFLLELIARLQELGTVPMMDTRAYAAWLE